MNTIEVALPRGPAHYWKMACGFGAAGFTVGDLAVLHQWRRLSHGAAMGRRDEAAGS